MSISYTLYLADKRAPDLGVPRPHLWAEAGPVRAPIDAYMKEDHGFLPHVSVGLRLDKEELDASQDDLVEVVIAMLRASSGDAVLLRENEYVALRRRGGKVEVLDDALWREPRRQAAAAAFARET